MIFGLVSQPQSIIKKFETSIPDKLELPPNYNIRPTHPTLFLSSAKPNIFTIYRYGMVPSGSNHEKILFEAPVENPNKPTHDTILTKDIILNQDTRNQIRSQRGIIPVDYFIVQSEQGKPYLFFMKDKKRPFGIGCVWDAWKKNILDELVYGFAVISVPVYGEFAKIGIKQVPLVIAESYYKRWLKKDTHLSSITALLNPIDEYILNGYPISDKILNCVDNERALIEPVGKLVVKDEKTVISFERKGHKKHKGNGMEWGKRLRN